MTASFDLGGEIYTVKNGVWIDGDENIIPYLQSITDNARLSYSPNEDYELAEFASVTLGGSNVRSQFSPIKRGIIY